MNTNTLEYLSLKPQHNAERKSQLLNTYLRVAALFFDLKLAFYRSVLERLTQV